MADLVLQWDLELRLEKVRAVMEDSKFDALLVTSNANLFYLTGMVINGYVFITQENYFVFVRRPVGLKGDNIHYIRKPEDIPEILQSLGVPLPVQIALEEIDINAAEFERLSKGFEGAGVSGGSGILLRAREVKTPLEMEFLKRTGQRQAEVYKLVPSLYEKGMTDLEFSAAIEHGFRKRGHIGFLRVSGFRMECYMGQIFAGDNAAAPSPYDFALGGAGLHTAFPNGLAGIDITEGTTVMVDMTGNFEGYITDMTRTFRVGEISEIAYRAHNLSLEIQKKLSQNFGEGAVCGDMYNFAYEMVKEQGLEQYFMGGDQKAGFIGHGVGVQLNELPVIFPKNRERLKAGMVIALEPKFVIPHVGAVGTENTYVVTKDGLECITVLDEDIIELI